MFTMQCCEQKKEFQLKAVVRKRAGFGGRVMDTMPGAESNEAGFHRTLTQREPLRAVPREGPSQAEQGNLEQ